MFLKHEERKFAKESLIRELGPWHCLKAHFEAERFQGAPLLDTSVDFEIEKFCITWADREKLMDDLAQVLRKYIL